jgi:hypothetical protein
MNITTFPSRPRSVLPLAGVIAAVSAAVALAFSGGHTAMGHEHAQEHAKGMHISLSTRR